MFNRNETELKELAELCKPIARFIANKNNSGTDCYSVNITEGTFEMVKTELYAPMKIEIEETAQEVSIQEQLGNLEIKMNSKRVSEITSNYSANHDKV